MLNYSFSSSNSNKEWNKKVPILHYFRKLNEIENEEIEGKNSLLKFK